MASGLDSAFTAKLLNHINLPATTAGVQASTQVCLVGPLKCLWLSAVRATDTGSDTEVSTGSGYTAGTGYSGLTFAAATAAAPSTSNSNVAASITNMPACTWAGNKVVDTAARTVTDGATTNTSTTITSLSACFSAADVGATVTGTGIPGSTTISSVTNAGTAVLSAAATATGTGVSLTITRSSVNTVWWSALTASKTVNAGDTVTIPSGSFQTTLA